MEKIKNIPYLSKRALANYLNKNPNTLRNWLDYWENKGELIRVKRGFYVFQDFIDKRDNALYYPKFLATKMIEPSYLSMESVLQNYQMLTDAVYNYSVITTKKTNSITNKFGTFNYNSIADKLFIGFSMESYGNMNWFIASKAKALFDYMYFNQNKFSEFRVSELEGMRLNLEIMKKNDWLEYEKYLDKTPKRMFKKMDKIYKLIQRKC
jgi:predicted transcriptional regulator of viral defense system